VFLGNDQPVHLYLSGEKIRPVPMPPFTTQSVCCLYQGGSLAVCFGGGIYHITDQFNAQIVPQGNAAHTLRPVEHKSNWRFGFIDPFATR
jgi:hypothetical protein